MTDPRPLTLDPRSLNMNRNLRIILLISVLFGVAAGAYEQIFPFYLRHLGVSYRSMGLIFTIATAAMFAVRIYLGNLSDQVGRKLFYSLSLLACGLSTVVTPALGSVWALALAKGVREAGAMTREVMHPVVIYEEDRGRFLNLISKIRGSEYLLLAGGTLSAGLTLRILGYGGVFGIAGAVILLGFAILALGFRERGAVRPKTEGNWRDLVSFDLSHNLKVLCITGFVFNIGLSCSHSFIMQLFFPERFGVSQATVSWVMMIHRVTLAVPMFFVARVPPRYFKSVYVGFMLYEGASISLSAVIPGFLPSAIVWMTHDLLGAGIWVPIQHTIIQHYSRDGVRGRDVSKTLAFPALGAVLGPYLAGYLTPIGIGLPFLGSGILMALSGLMLLALRLDDLVAAESRAAPARRSRSPRRKVEAAQ